MVERLLCKQDAAGSSPAVSTRKWPEAPSLQIFDNRELEKRRKRKATHIRDRAGPRGPAETRRVSQGKDSQVQSGLPARRSRKGLHERPGERSACREARAKGARPRILLSVYGRTTDALASGGYEGRGRLRQAPGSRQQALIRRYPNGATRRPSPAAIGG